MGIRVTHPPLESIRILSRPGNDTATLFRVRDGKNHYEALTRDQLLTLIESAAEALRKMETKP